MRPVPTGLEEAGGGNPLSSTCKVPPSLLWPQPLLQRWGWRVGTTLSLWVHMPAGEGGVPTANSAWSQEKEPLSAWENFAQGIIENLPSWPALGMRLIPTLP